MNYKDFDTTKIYSAIHSAGIRRDSAVDVAFDYIKRSKHDDVVREEMRVKDLMGVYRFRSENSIEYSDKVINQVKEMQEDGQDVSEKEIEYMLRDSGDIDVRDIDKMTQRVLAETKKK